MCFKNSLVTILRETKKVELLSSLIRVRTIQKMINVSFDSFIGPINHSILNTTRVAFHLAEVITERLVLQISMSEAFSETFFGEILAHAFSFSVCFNFHFFHYYFKTFSNPVHLNMQCNALELKMLLLNHHSPEKSV